MRFRRYFGSDMNCTPVLHTKRFLVSKMRISTARGEPIQPMHDEDSSIRAHCYCSFATNPGTFIRSCATLVNLGFTFRVYHSRAYLCTRSPNTILATVSIHEFGKRNSHYITFSKEILYARSALLTNTNQPLAGRQRHRSPPRHTR